MENAENPTKSRRKISRIMKKLLLPIVLCLITCVVYAQTGAPHGGFFESTPNPYSTANQNAISDGWYEATILYTSHTGHKATYTLNVRVERLCVVAIDFGNGGSVHKGYNNSGYYYRGGGLSFERDRNGYVVAASTIVTVSYDNGGWQQFNIYIQ